MELNDLANIENQLKTKNKTKTIRHQIDEKIEIHHQEMIEIVFNKGSFILVSKKKVKIQYK